MKYAGDVNYMNQHTTVRTSFGVKGDGGGSRYAEHCDYPQHLKLIKKCNVQIDYKTLKLNAF
jgi:hypothetical protein